MAGFRDEKAVIGPGDILETPRHHRKRNPNPLLRAIIFPLKLVLVVSFLYAVYTKRPASWSLTPKTTPHCHGSEPSVFGLASPDLHWQSCGDRFQCANLSVPLDYLNPSNGRTASIAITRYLALNRTSKTGTVIFNPGGPGGSGTGSTYRLGPILDKILQGQYDILGFDPRGINKTLPFVSCLQSLVTRFSLEQIVGSTAPGLNSHDVGIWDAFAQVIAEECEANSGADVLPFVNTPTVARDIASIIDALHAENKHKVSYWGFSYGTNLGAIFAGMFPNKLHKIILDGIRSPFDAREIYNWGYTSLASQNDMVEGYFAICEAVGKERCPLAGGEKSVKNTVMDLFDSLYERPLPVSGPVTGLVTFLEYKSFFYGTLYKGTGWPRFAEITAAMLNGDGSLFLQATNPGPQGFENAEAGTAVLCSDAEVATNYSLAEWKQYVANMTALSFIAGDSRSLGTLPCRHWYTEPNERWLGDFKGVELETPVLLLGNTNDPATPIASARRLLTAMGDNAVLLEQRSFGHCSISAVSSCTWGVVLDYLLEEKVPKNGKVCEVDDEDYGDYFPRVGKACVQEKSELREMLNALSLEVGYM